MHRFSYTLDDMPWWAFFFLFFLSSPFTSIAFAIIQSRPARQQLLIFDSKLQAVSWKLKLGAIKKMTLNVRSLVYHEPPAVNAVWKPSTDAAMFGNTIWAATVAAIAALSASQRATETSVDWNKLVRCAFLLLLWRRRSHRFRDYSGGDYFPTAKAWGGWKRYKRKGGGGGYNGGTCESKLRGSL